MSVQEKRDNNEMMEGREERDWRGDGELIMDRLYVGDLDSGILTDHQLAHFFSRFGEVTHSVVIRHRGYGFVTFRDAAVVRRLLEMREPLVWGGRRLILRQARRKRQQQQNVREDWGHRRNNGPGEQFKEEFVDNSGKEMAGRDFPSQGEEGQPQEVKCCGISSDNMCPALPVASQGMPLQSYLSPDGYWYTNTYPNINMMAPQSQPYLPHHLPNNNSMMILPQPSYSGGFQYYDQYMVTPDGNIIYPVYAFPTIGWPTAPAHTPTPYTVTYPGIAPVAPDPATTDMMGTLQELKCDPPTGSKVLEDETIVGGGLGEQQQVDTRTHVIQHNIDPGVAPYKVDSSEGNNIGESGNRGYGYNRQGNTGAGTGGGGGGRSTGEYSGYTGYRHQYQGQDRADYWRKYRMNMYGNWIEGGNYSNKKNVKRKKGSASRKEGVKEEVGPQPDLLQGPMENLEIV